MSTFAPPPPAPITQTLQGECLGGDPSKRTIVMRYRVGEIFCNPVGMLQGGIITALLDDALGSLGPAFLNGHAATISLSVQFIAPLPPGAITVAAQITGSTSRLVFAEAQAFVEGDNVAARASTVARLITKRDRA